MLQDVAVDFGCGVQGGVAEAFGYDFQFLACFQEHGGVGVAEGVEASGAEGFFAVVVEVPHGVGVDGGSVLEDADSFGVFVVLPVAQAVLRSFFVRGFQYGIKFSAEGDVPDGARGFRHGLDAAVDEGGVDVQHLGFHVDVVP